MSDEAKPPVAATSGTGDKPAAPPAPPPVARTPETAPQPGAVPDVGRADVLTVLRSLSDTEKAALGLAVAAPTPTQELTVHQIRAAIAQLSTEDKRVIFGVDLAQPAGKTPKFSPALKAVPDEELPDLLAALSRVQKGSSEAEQHMLFEQNIQNRWPGVAMAARANSSYRQKPLGHSVMVAITFLNARYAGEMQ